jgi:hypothetical protein
VRFYIAQSAKSWTIPNAALLDGLATPSCVTCRNLQDTAAQLERDKQKYGSTPIQVDRAERLNGTSTRVVFELKLTELAVDLVDANGGVVDSFPKNNITRAAALVWQEGQWRVDGISE